MASVNLKNKSIYLIGCPTKKIGGRKLPTNHQVLQSFFHKHNILKLTIRQSATIVVKEIIELWNESGIPVRHAVHATSQLVKLHKDWQNLRKSRLRKKSSTQISKEHDFRIRLNRLFDIAPQDVLKSITEHQRVFLEDQRSSRRGSISTMVNGSNKISDENDDLIEISNAEIKQHHLSSSQASGSSTLTHGDRESSGLPDSQQTVSNFSDELEQDNSTPKLNVITPKLVATLDRSKISTRNAAHILLAAADSLGVDVRNTNLSRSTIYKQRIKFRAQMAERLKKDFRSEQCLVIHWDGKLLPDSDGSKKIDRLPIVISGNGQEQLLGVPKIENGTGINQANAVIDTMNEWNIANKIKAMCFDTTSTNTGRKKGTCILLEQKLERSLIYLACRHHVNEIMLRSVVETCWPATTGPDVPIFKRFKLSWEKINTTQYETGLDDQLIVLEISESASNEIKSFILNQFEIMQPRSDYREFLELAYIFLNGVPPRGIKFKTPGAMHHARWLSKAIYCLKIFMFKNQFKLNAHEVRELRHICIFIVKYYVRSWFTAPHAIQAPHHDLNLLKNLYQHRDINTKISDAACAKLSNHLWYLSEELVALSFFDNISIDVKRKMAHAIKHRESNVINSKRAQLNGINRESLHLLDLSEFVNKKSLFLFEQFELPHDFVEIDPELWETSESYRVCETFFKNLKVVNDVAERGVALMSEYNNHLTKDEEQKQFVMQIVYDHRKNYPTCNKTNFN